MNVVSMKQRDSTATLDGGDVLFTGMAIGKPFVDRLTGRNF